MYLSEVTVVDNIHDEGELKACCYWSYRCTFNTALNRPVFHSDLVLDAANSTWKIEQPCGLADMALRVVIHPRDGEQPLNITLVAQTAHEKDSWLSDLKQVCFHYIGWFRLKT